MKAPRRTAAAPIGFSEVHKGFDTLVAMKMGNEKVHTAKATATPAVANFPETRVGVGRGRRVVMCRPLCCILSRVLLRFGREIRSWSGIPLTSDH